ncbi:MAG: hypothetical protein LBB93_02080 [Elusimicrobiota bacterium]|nr:hypothetical protein [Elusimicrobiota bacterium]
MKPSRPPIPLGGLNMWLPLSLTTHDNAHDKKTNPAHFSNPAPQSPVPFRLVRPPFHYPANDHTGGFETLPYSGRPPSVFADNAHDKKTNPHIFQIPHRNHPFRFVLSARRFIIP